MSLLYFVTLYHCKVWSAVGQRSLKIACNWVTSENSYPRSLLKIITVYSICVINKKCSGFNPSNLHRVPVLSLRNDEISYDRWKIECSLILKGQQGLSTIHTIHAMSAGWWGCCAKLAALTSPPGLITSCHPPLISRSRPRMTFAASAWGWRPLWPWHWLGPCWHFRTVHYGQIMGTRRMYTLWSKISRFVEGF